MNTMKNSRGFTLVEILFAVAIGVIVIGAGYVAMISGQRSSVGIEQKVVAQQDVRSTLEIMSMEIGMASFNPNFVTGIWINPVGCAIPSANQGYRGIQEATLNTITVEMDIQESGIVGDNTNEVIAYAYDIPNRRITRSTNCGNAEPILGRTVAAPGSVRVMNSDLNIPVFRYFNGVGTEIPGNPTVSAAEIPNIRRIDITLAIETQDVDPNTRQPRTMVYSNSVIARNHAIAQ